MNADLCDFHPRIVEAGLALGWEFLGHNKTNTQRLSGLAVEEERELIHSSLARIAQATGRKPAGWLGAALAETWNTLDILIEEGVGYVADWTNDDQPYVMSTESGKIVSIPYSYELNDSPFFYYRNGTPDEFEAMIKRQFDVLYEEGSASGRVMAICLHPFIIGVPHRIRALQGALSYICNHHQVWFATGEEIVGHYCREVAPELLR
jgi:peptidoglycan/xylan/chitin deacetylase (PgdA/CDA1 family)